EIIKNNLGKLNDECWNLLCKNTNIKVLDIIQNNSNKLDENCWNIINSLDIENEHVFKLLTNRINKTLGYQFNLYQNNIHDKLLDYVSDNIDEIDLYGWNKLCYNIFYYDETDY